ncbi:BatA domain-containing protein [Microvirga sp. STS02]|uniref:BatA domain-containing protein n=1 Tax=Hymenobacter negativus TaxID=2795026 RepID=UPI0018DDFFEF|nr:MULTISPECIES: BatA domain-containing protein [Bacteria]MBH8571089.1 BatA domain-containing protein [Hymenobacter negativus]MBR7210826.1 BatA domain-containing protein [Microvirga sp. STS02]
MFILLNPAALPAFLGLLVPVAIHLWNRRPGREVAVGSLRWLTAGANRRLRNLKLEQLWLLLLRAALLAVLAVAVAGPVWRTALPTSRGVVLLSADVAGLPALAELKPTIDSLRRKGYVLRWLAAGFPRVSGSVWQRVKTGQSGTATDSMAALATTRPQSQEFAWARVQQAAGAFPGQPLLVVTGAALRNFQGSHAPLPAAVRWQALPEAKATNWLQAAALRGDSLRLELGQSTESQTRFQTTTMAQPTPGATLRVAGLAPLRLQNTATGTRITLVKTATSSEIDTAAVAVQTRPLRAIIYATADYRSDARVLQAGLRAASAGLTVALELSTTTQAPSPASPPDWLFWLSDAPVPTAWQNAVQQGTRLWLEAAGPGVADTSHLALNDAEAAPVTVFRRDTAALGKSTLAMWTDGRGRAVLSRQTLGRGAIYHLATRLNSDWSELAEAPQLPAWLLELLQPAIPTNAQRMVAGVAFSQQDQRALDPAQLVKPGPTAAETTEGAMQQAPAFSGFRQTDLRPWLVLLAGLLLLFERLLARRRETLTPPAAS